MSAARSDGSLLDFPTVKYETTIKAEAWCVSLRSSTTSGLAKESIAD